MPLLPVDKEFPLYVDLDGSLIKSDSLWEGLWFAARKRPLACLKACMNIGAGRAKFKRRIAVTALGCPSQLPYRHDVLTFLLAEAGVGRSVILATAADELVAWGVAEHLGLFEHVIASDGVINRKGRDKLEAIRRATSQRPFLYLGNSTSDLPVWQASAGAIVVGNNRQVLKTLRQSGVTIHEQIPSRSSLLATFRGAVRVHQWPKNLLVLLPLFLGHRTWDGLAWKSGLLVLAVFCLAASVAYVINDLLDLEADRQHSQKRTRPFASGDLSIPMGLLLLLGLVSSGVALSLLLSTSAQIWVATYFVFTLFYSIYLKTRMLADVVGLAMLYVLRVMAGGAATAIVISPWTLTFCLFFFYSLALAKRYGELRLLSENQIVPARRGYQKIDLGIVEAIGVSSGVISVVVISLYISSPEVALHYCSPAWLWLACPVTLYWLGRLWILANRGVIAEDPLLFSSKDKISYITCVCMVMIWLAASVCL